MRTLSRASRTRVVTTGLLLTAAAASGARGAGAQAPARQSAEQAATAVARAAIDALAAGRYDSVAALVDPRLLAEQRASAIAMERSRRSWEAREDSVERGLVRPGVREASQMDADPPPSAEVRAYLVAQRARQRAAMPNLLELEYGVTSAEALEALTPAALFASALYARSPEGRDAWQWQRGARQAGARPGMAPPPSPPPDSAAAAARRPVRRIVGVAAANDSTVYVTYEVARPAPLPPAGWAGRDPCADSAARRVPSVLTGIIEQMGPAVPAEQPRPALLVVRRTDAGWRLASARNDPDLFRGDEGVVSWSAPSPTPDSARVAQHLAELRRQVVTWAGGAGRAVLAAPRAGRGARRGAAGADSTALPDRLVLTQEGQRIEVPTAESGDLAMLLVAWHTLRAQAQAAAATGGPTAAPACLLYTSHAADDQ